MPLARGNSARPQSGSLWSSDSSSVFGAGDSEGDLPGLDFKDAAVGPRMTGQGRAVDEDVKLREFGEGPDDLIQVSDIHDCRLEAWEVAPYATAPPFVSVPADNVVTGLHEPANDCPAEAFSLVAAACAGHDYQALRQCSFPRKYR
jgi:hypothetical protein